MRPNQRKMKFLVITQDLMDKFMAYITKPNEITRYIMRPNKISEYIMRPNKTQITVKCHFISIYDLVKLYFHRNTNLAFLTSDHLFSIHVCISKYFKYF